jgi:hypothetical protein
MNESGTRTAMGALPQWKLHIVEAVQDQHREFQLAGAIQNVKSAHCREASHDNLTRRGLCLCECSMWPAAGVVGGVPGKDVS